MRYELFDTSICAAAGRSALCYIDCRQYDSNEIDDISNKQKQCKSSHGLLNLYVISDGVPFNVAHNNDRHYNCNTQWNNGKYNDVEHDIR